jgi:hypothetical protein
MPRTQLTSVRRILTRDNNAALLCLARRRCDLIHKMLHSGLSYGELPIAGKTGDNPAIDYHHLNLTNP